MRIQVSVALTNIVMPNETPDGGQYGRIKPTDIPFRINLAIQALYQERIELLEKRRTRLEAVALLRPEYIKALDSKENMLVVRAMLFGRLAAEDNHLAGLCAIKDCRVTNLHQRKTEIADAIQALEL